jgi:excisionase family DNA binding protein
VTTVTDVGLRNVREAATWLGIPPKSLYAMTAARSVPFTKVGRHIRFSQEHLDAIVAAGEQGVASVPTRLRVVAARAGYDGTHPPSGPSTPPPPPGPKKRSNTGRAA